MSRFTMSADQRQALLAARAAHKAALRGDAVSTSSAGPVPAANCGPVSASSPAAASPAAPPVPALAQMLKNVEECHVPNPVTSAPSPTTTSPAAEPAPALAQMLKNVEECHVPDLVTSAPSPAAEPAPALVPMLRNVEECHIPGPVTSASSTDPSTFEPSPLLARQAQALALLLAGHTASAVARKIGVTPTTISRWKSSPAFRDELARRQSDNLDAATARIGRVLLKSLARVESCIDKRDSDFALKLLTLLRAHTLLHLPSPGQGEGGAPERSPG